MKHFRIPLVACSALIVLASFPATAQKPQQPPTAADDGQSAAQKYFSDIELINQDGQKMRFYSDLLKGRVIVINSFFVTCTNCDLLTQNMRKLQDMLGEKVGKDVYLISITVDPLMDTPERLKRFARKNGAKPGWFFLSGKKENVDWALQKLGQYVENKQDHSSIMIMGNERTGLWKKAFGLGKPEDLFAVVESVLSDK